jgi:magnesium transporter
MRIMQLTNDGQAVPLPISPESWPGLWEKLSLQRDPFWLDLTGAADGTFVESLLLEQFGFHPLAVDDALHETHAPKLDNWESYLYIVLQDVAYQAEQRQILLPEIDVFLGERYLVTYHKESATAVDQLWGLVQGNERWLQHGADHLLYRLIDEIVNNYTAALEQLEDDVIQLESDIFAEPAPRLLEQLTVYKRIILRIRRVLTSQREVVNKLARDIHAVIDAEDRVYFRDVYDHLVRLHELSDNTRELVTSSMEIYLSLINNRMNDIMKTLTLITTLFMPLTFLTGFFGMNFFQAVMPSSFWTGAPMLIFILLIMLLLPMFMYGWIRRRAWM